MMSRCSFFSRSLVSRVNHTRASFFSRSACLFSHAVRFFSTNNKESAADFTVSNHPTSKNNSTSPKPISISNPSKDPYRSPYVDPTVKEWVHLWENMYELEPSGSVSSAGTGTLIWLHGLGEKVTTLQTKFQMITPQGVRCLVPQAWKIDVDALGEHHPEEHSWYNLYSDEFKEDITRGILYKEDQNSLEEITGKLHALLDRESQRQGSHRIILAGFAQGGALALHAGLNYSKPLAGIISFSGYLPLPQLYPEHLNTANSRTPVLAVHGNSDKAIPLAFSRPRYQILQQLKVPFELRTEFSMGHFMSTPSIVQTQQWMVQTLRKAPPPQALKSDEAEIISTKK